VNIKNN